MSKHRDLSSKNILFIEKNSDGLRVIKEWLNAKSEKIIGMCVNNFEIKTDLTSKLNQI